MKRVLLILLLATLLWGPVDGRNPMSWEECQALSEEQRQALGPDLLTYMALIRPGGMASTSWDTISQPPYMPSPAIETEIVYLGTAELWLGVPLEGTISGPVYEFVGDIKLTLPGDMSQTKVCEDPVYIVAPTNLHRRLKEVDKNEARVFAYDDLGMWCDDCYIAKPSVDCEGIVDIYHATNLILAWTNPVLNDKPNELLYGRGYRETTGYMRYRGEGYFTGVALQSDSQPEPEQTIIVPTFSGSGYSAPFGMSVVFADISTSMELDGVHYDCVNCRWSPPVPARYGMSQNCCH